LNEDDVVIGELLVVSVSNPVDGIDVVCCPSLDVEIPNPDVGNELPGKLLLFPVLKSVNESDVVCCTSVDVGICNSIKVVFVISCSVLGSPVIYSVKDCNVVNRSGVDVLILAVGMACDDVC
jgi:hypothetical protein